MVEEAVKRGFKSIGFSGHAFVPLYSRFCMTEEKTVAYKHEVARLKERYKGVIDVYCGLEYDLQSTDPLDGYDYVIGSVHYVEKDGAVLGVDGGGVEVIKGNIEKYFGGDGVACAKLYYETLASMPSVMKKIDVVGHFDLITKFNGNGDFIDEAHPRYKAAALEALHALAEKVKVFEINTGAMARGYRQNPYPATFLLKEMHALGVGVIISTDCHDKKYIDYFYDGSLELLKSVGYKEIMYFDGNGFVPVKIN